MRWYSPHSPDRALAALGIIPSFLDEADTRPAHEQIAANYIGGWSPFTGFYMDACYTLYYEGDPPLALQAGTRLREELIFVYDYGWVAIVQPNGTYEVSRCD